jgi:hypothetical protein
MDARTILTRGVATGLRLGRGTADRLVGVAGPPLSRLTDSVVSKVRRVEPRTTTTTFTPSKRTTDVPKPEPASAPQKAKSPSPASVARNIGPARPTAKPARAAKPKSVPGAKLPPPRASTS